MPATILNPPGLHDPLPFGYSHTVRVSQGELVFVAGQYGSDTNGHVVSPDFTEQARRALRNLGTALSAVGLDFGHVVRIGTYIVDHDEARLAALLELIRQTWGERPPAQTLIGVASLALPGMLFEIDAVAARP